MIEIIKNEQRYRFQNDWLSAHWHFSFDHYYDPRNMGFGPLRVFNDDTVRPSSGFGMHGHREMEIVTYVLDGELEHKDSTGGSDRIRAGEVQRMSAGTGIRHSEYNPSDTAPVHLLQMWVTPAVSGLAPSYEQKRFTQEQRAGKWLAIASGQDAPGAVKIHQDATFYVAALRPGDQLAYSLKEGRRAYFFVIEGQAQMNGNELSGGDQARIQGESEMQFTASSPSEIILIDLP